MLFASVFCTACHHSVQKDARSDAFISLADNHFQLRGEAFFPVMLNYVPSFQGEDDFLIAPHVHYDSVGYAEAVGPEAVRQQLERHFQLIKDLGFNTIRLCFDRIGQENGHYYYGADRHFYLNKRQDVKSILAGLRRYVEQAEEHDLRIMLLIKGPINDSELENFTVRLLKEFRGAPAIFAYDFMNEPLYFDSVPDRTKPDALRIVKHWKELMTQYAPEQLFTVGFAEPIEVFEWDPAMLPVDFVQFHTYHPLRVPSEIYWYSHYVKKPWMIGETGLPADNDSISYCEQAAFMRDAYRLVRDAGGCGFGWWTFQDEPGTHFEAAFTGLLNHEGHTPTQDGKFLYGTLKPAASCVRDFQSYLPRPIQRPCNYYNMMGYRNIRICGTIVDKMTGKPVEGAVIRGWNEDWSVGMNTFSDEKGSFTLYSNDECTHFEISAPRMSKVKFDKKLSYTSKSGAKFDVNKLNNKELEYHKINFQPFLSIRDTANKSYTPFGFEPELFNQFEWEGQMGVVLLRIEN